MTSTSSGSVPGNDTIYATTGTNYIIGGGGSDTIHGGGTNYVIGDTGTFDFTNGVLTGVIAGTGRDSGTDTIDAGTGGTNVITLTESQSTQANTFTLAGDSWSGTLQGAGSNNTLVETTPPLVGGSVNYSLSDTSLAVTGGVTQTLTLTSIQTADLTGASTTSNTFNVSGWSGSGTLTGQSSAANLLVATDNSATFTLTNSLLGRTGDGNLTLAKIYSATLTGGAASNTFNVSNWSGTVTLDGAGGNDYYNLTLSGIGTGTFVVSDSGTTPGEINTLNVTGSANMVITSTQVLVGAKQQVTYSGIELLNVKGGVSGLVYYVQSTLATVTTTLTTKGGSNTIDVGSTAGNTPGTPGLLDTIQGPLVVVGGGTDTMNIDDTGDTSPGTLTQTTTSLTGLGMGTGGIQYQGLSVLNINLGRGGNTIYLRGNPAITENLNTGSGANIISIGSQAQSSIVTDTNSNDAYTTLGNATDTGSVLDNILGTINITGSGADTLNVDDSGSMTAAEGGMWANKLEFLDPTTGYSTVKVTINFTGIAGIYISLSQGDDEFLVTDTITSSSTTPVVVIDGNGGDDTFLVFDSHAVMTINGGSGEDTFYNFGNSAVLNLNGDAGDDTFYVYASVSAGATNVGAGTAADSNGNTIYSYRVNAPVNIDGGTGNDKVFIFGTVLNDTFIITSTSVTGAGLDVNYTNIEEIAIAGLGGNDTFYIESIAIPTTIIGDGTIVLPSVAGFLQALNATLPDLSGGAPPATSFNDTFYVGWAGASYIPGSLSLIQAPLIIYGDNGPSGPGGTTIPIVGAVNTIYVDDSADTQNQTFNLTSSAVNGGGVLTGTGFGTGGSMSYDDAVENLNFQMGNGNNTITIDGNDTATQTSIYGGRGNDTFIVNDDYALQAPLALFGGLNTFPGDSLIVNGGAAGNTFNVTGFTIDGLGATVSYEGMESLTINAGGATAFNVNGDSIPTWLNGGSGNDTFNINSNIVSLYLAGAAGNDSYNINANSGMLTATGDSGNDAGSDSFTVNGNSGTLTLNGGAGGDSYVINGNSGTLTANGGAGNDSFTVNSLSSPATLKGNGGNNSFTVNAPLSAALTVNGGNTIGDVLTINGTMGNDYFNVTGSVVSGVDAPITYAGTNLVINGVAGNDTFQIDGTSAFTTRISGGIYGNDTFNVQAATGPLYLIGGAVGNNTFNLGSLAPIVGGTLANLVGPIFITGGANLMRLISLGATGINTVNVDDSGDMAGNSGTLTSSTLTGFGMGAGVNFVSVDFMNITLGPGADTMNVQGTNSTTVTRLNTGSGANVINIGSEEPNAGGIINGIQGPLIVIGSGADTMDVDDTGGTGAKTGTLTATTLSGLGMGTGGITYSGLAALNISLGSGGNTFTISNTSATTVTTLNSGSGNDTVNLLTDSGTTNINTQGGSDTININATGAATGVNTGSGTNTVNVGSLAPTIGGIVNSIQGALTVVGSGTDAMNVDDRGSTSAKTGTLTATTLTGLGIGAGGITYSGLAALNISLGSGGDTILITSTSSATTRINGGAGNDTFNVRTTTGTFYLNGDGGNNTFNFGSLSPGVGGTLNGIAGAVFISGGNNLMRLIDLAGTGVNTVNVDDSGDVTNSTGTLTSSTLTGLGLGAGISFVSVNFMNINLGTGNDTFNIQSTNSATATMLNTGAGTNTVNVGSLAPTIGGIVNTIQGALTVVGSGADTMNVDDTGSTGAKTGILTATTLTGLGMGAGGITYSGLAALNISLGGGGNTFTINSTISPTVTTLNSGSGSDTVNVQATGGTTIVNTGAGTNTVNVGSLMPTISGVLNNIQGALTIMGNGGDTLNVDNTGSTANNSGTLTATALTGLSMGAGGITYSGLAALNISLGSGNDTFTITGVTNTTVTTVNGEGGANTAIMNFSGNFGGNLTLLDFATATLTVGGDFSGQLTDAGAVTPVSIGGSLTSTGVLTVGSIATMTVGGNLAGLLSVSGLLGTLTVDGGAPGQIVVGSVNVITVLAGTGNTLLNVTAGDIQREILATPVAGGAMPNTVQFAFVYDSETTATPQAAIQVINFNPVARLYNLAFVVVNSATAKFDLTLIDSKSNGATGLSNISVDGDLLMKLTAPELALFNNLNTSSRAGVVLPADSITGVEVSGNLPIGFVDVAGIEGLAFAVLTTAAGSPVTITSPLGSSSSIQVLWNYLGSTPTLNPATDAFVIPFNQTNSVRLYAHVDTNPDMELVMTLTAETSDNLPVTATAKLVPTTSGSIAPLVQSVALSGADGSINSNYSIANITSTGPLGDVTVSGSAGSTMDNDAGLGNITAPSIFGSIDVTNAGIYGVIQTTSGDIGETILGTNNQITGVTSIISNGALTGQIISRGNLISSVKTNSTFSGVIAAQGNIGAIQTLNGNAVLTGNALTRFGGINVAGADSGQIIAVGNDFGDLTISGSMTGRIAVQGQAVAGLVASRLGILGNVTATTFAAGSAIISGGLIGDATGGTTVNLGSAKETYAERSNRLPTMIQEANYFELSSSRCTT